MKKLKKNIGKISKPYLFITLLMGGAIILLSLQQVPKWVAPASANNLKNPYAENATIIPDAKALYNTYCSPCHGTKGKGDGPAAVALTIKPADHTSSALQSETDGSLFWKISEGRKPMPQFKGSLTDNQRWELVTYIRTLAAKKK